MARSVEIHCVFNFGHPRVRPAISPSGIQNQSQQAAHYAQQISKNKSFCCNSHWNMTVAEHGACEEMTTFAPSIIIARKDGLAGRINANHFEPHVERKPHQLLVHSLFQTQSIHRPWVLSSQEGCPERGVGAHLMHEALMQNLAHLPCPAAADGLSVHPAHGQHPQGGAHEGGL